MPARVKLRDIVDAMDTLQRGWQAFLNRETGEIVTLTDEGTVLGDDENVDEELLESESYVALPDSFEIDEWSLMEQFSREQGDRAREELLDAIRGRGAFRLFKATVRRLGIEQQWYRFRESSLEQIAREWLDENRISYDESVQD